MLLKANLRKKSPSFSQSPEIVSMFYKVSTQQTPVKGLFRCHAELVTKSMLPKEELIFKKKLLY